MKHVQPTPGDQPVRSGHPVLACQEGRPLLPLQRSASLIAEFRQNVEDQGKIRRDETTCRISRTYLAQLLPSMLLSQVLRRSAFLGAVNITALINTLLKGCVSLFRDLPFSTGSESNSLECRFPFTPEAEEDFAI